MLSGDVTNINRETSHIRDRRENKRPLSLPTTLSPFLLSSYRHTWRISRKSNKIPVIISILHPSRPHLLYELQPQLLSQRRWWGRLPHNTASAPFVLSLILGTTRLEKSPLVTCPCSPTQQAPLQRSKSWVRLFNIAFGLQKNVSNVWTAVLMPGWLQGLRL